MTFGEFQVINARRFAEWSDVEMWEAFLLAEWYIRDAARKAKDDA